MRIIKISTYIILCLVSFIFLFFLISDTFSGLFIHGIDLLRGDPPIPEVNEVVMLPDSTLKAQTITGHITIKAGKGLKRSYSWDGVTKSLLMDPRTKRWYGNFGIHYPGSGYHWFPGHKGISRAVAEEGQQHFNNEKDALEWINKQKGWCPTVYRDDGLVVCYGHVLQRKQMNIEVTQIYINGKKPTKLPGSSNDSINTSWD